MTVRPAIGYKRIELIQSSTCLISSRVSLFFKKKKKNRSDKAADMSQRLHGLKGAWVAQVCDKSWYATWGPFFSSSPPPFPPPPPLYYLDTLLTFRARGVRERWPVAFLFWIFLKNKILFFSHFFFCCCVIWNAMPILFCRSFRVGMFEARGARERRNVPFVVGPFNSVPVPRTGIPIGRRSSRHLPQSHLDSRAARLPTSNRPPPT